MKILVYGAGAIGAYFGGRLLEAGEDVTFFVRPRRAQQLQRAGLRIQSPEGAFVAPHVQTASDIAELGQINLIIVAVKGYHLEEAIPQIVDIAQRKGAFVMPLLNGMEHITQLQQQLGKDKVIGGFASIIATLNNQGHVLHTSGSSAIQIGALHEAQQDIIDYLVALNERIHTSIVLKDDILKGMWSKYIFITAFSGITSAMQQPAGSITSNDATLQTAKHIVYEMSAIARAEGIPYSDEEIEKEAGRLAKFKSNMTSSMHQDMRKGLPIEVEHLHGGALRLAKQHNIATPTIATIYGVLKPYELGAPHHE